MTFSLSEHTDLGERCWTALDEMNRLDAVPKHLVNRYLTNLGRIFEGEKLIRGTPVICIGTGRCGSTSLIAILRSIDGCIATHENPPVLQFANQRDRQAFHFKRMTLLTRYVPVVADANPRWLLYVDAFLGAFKHGKVIALYRDADDTERSFAKVDYVTEGPHGLRAYIDDYHREIERLQQTLPAKRFLPLAMEGMNSRSSRDLLFEFVGRVGTYDPIHMNRGLSREGVEYRF